jgi:hypothetical protein
MTLQVIGLLPTVLPAERDGISDDEIQAQLNRILSSKVFARSRRMRRFLEYTVEQSLLNNSTSVKEYTVALCVYDKPASFDPRMDPIVRVEASRLRSKLRDYYEDEGRSDPILISIRKNGYSPTYERWNSRPAAPVSMCLDIKVFDDPQEANICAVVSERPSPLEYGKTPREFPNRKFRLA